MSALLNDTELELALKEVPHWEVKGKTLHRSFKFKKFLEGIGFVGRLADVAEAVGHHPDVDIRYTHIAVSLTTHDAGGLTAADFDLAKRVDGLFD